MSTPLVSICIPVHNREQLLAASIQSALDQTVQDLEVVVVDNASTDRTWEVARKFAAHDSRVRVFRSETNRGPVANWRRCLHEARGTYGKLLFSDDLLYPGFLEKTLPFLEDPQVGFAFTAAEIGAEPGRGTVQYRWQRMPAVVPSRVFVNEVLVRHEVDVPYSPGAGLFRMGDMRANLLDEIPSPTIRDFGQHGAGVDLLLYLLTAKSYPSVAHVSEPLSFFRAHPGSITIASPVDVGECYRQARVWFAFQHEPRHVLDRVLAVEWVQACRAGKRLADPRHIAEGLIVDPGFRCSFRTLLIGSACLAVLGCSKVGRVVLGPRRGSNKRMVTVRKSDAPREGL